MRSLFCLFKLKIKLLVASNICALKIKTKKGLVLFFLVLFPSSTSVPHQYLQLSSQLSRVRKSVKRRKTHGDACYTGERPVRVKKSVL